MVSEMIQLLAIGILVAIVRGAEYETLQQDLDSSDLNIEVQTFLRDNEYYSIDCGNGYTRHYREKPLDEKYSCWSWVEGAVLQVVRESTHFNSGRRTAVSWQYALTSTYWKFNDERRWCIAQCSTHETTVVDYRFPHLPLPPSSDDLSKPIYWHEQLPYNMLVGPPDDIVALNKSELLRQNPLLFTPPAPSRKKRKLRKRAIDGTTKNIKSMADLKQENEKTACKRDTFLRYYPHRCPPGCIPIGQPGDMGPKFGSNALPPGLGSQQTGGQPGGMGPKFGSNPLPPGLGSQQTGGQPGGMGPKFGSNPLPPGLGNQQTGGQPGDIGPKFGSNPLPPGLGNQQTGKGESDGVVGTSPPQHFFNIITKIVDWFKKIFS